jgi:hypothetical protein
VQTHYELREYENSGDVQAHESGEVDADFGTKFRLLAVAARLAHIDRLTAIGSSSSPQLRVKELIAMYLARIVRPAGTKNKTVFSV